MVETAIQKEDLRSAVSAGKIVIEELSGFQRNGPMVVVNNAPQMQLTSHLNLPSVADGPADGDAIAIKAAVERLKESQRIEAARAIPTTAKPKSQALLPGEVPANAGGVRMIGPEEGQSKVEQLTDVTAPKHEPAKPTEWNPVAKVKW